MEADYCFALKLAAASKFAINNNILFDLFPIWGWRIEFSTSTFSGIVRNLPLLVSPSCRSCNNTQSQFCSSYISVSTTSISHVVITISYSVFLSTWLNHLSMSSLRPISSFLIFSIVFITIIHLNIPVSVLLASFFESLSMPKSHIHTLEQV